MLSVQKKYFVSVITFKPNNQIINYTQIFKKRMFNSILFIFFWNFGFSLYSPITGTQKLLRCGEIDLEVRC
ncbi:hypothetical protein HanIR_Chr11g0545951 [Helianthus annuus]|nr:hypothetical protein HanIR_Chr11g0545951 [Helianthus annuus]